MSAFGPKRTWSGAPHMSAFGARADMRPCRKSRLGVGNAGPACDTLVPGFQIAKFGRDFDFGDSRVDEACKPRNVGHCKPVTSKKWLPRYNLIEIAHDGERSLRI